MKEAPGILMTGATGFLGSNLLRRFLADGLRTLILVRRTSDLSRIQDMIHRVKVIYTGEIDYEKTLAESEVNAVVHCATNYGRKTESSLSILEANLMLPLKLLEAGARCGLKCFINTDTILDKGVSSYSLSKSQFRDWLKLYSDRLTCVNVLLEHFYGPDDDESKFVAWVVSSLLRGVKDMNLTSGEQKRDFVYIDDVIEAFAMILPDSLLRGKGFLCYEVGTGNLVSIADLVRLTRSLAANSSTRLNFGAVPYRENEVMSSQVNLSAIKALGWSPRVTLEEGLKRTIGSEKGKIT